MKNKVFLSILLAAVVLGMSLYYINNYLPNASEVYLDDTMVGVVARDIKVPELLEKLIQEKLRRFQKNIYVNQKVTVKPVRVAGEKLITKKELNKLLEVQAKFYTDAVSIRIAGQGELIVDNQRTASDLLKKVKEHYLPTAKGAMVKELAIENQVDVISVQVTPDKILSREEALSLLIDGIKKMKTHQVVEGESLWTIALSHNLWPEDLWEANPQLESEVLQIGQELKMITADPMVNVFAAWQETKEESIPYQVKVEQDQNLSRGKEQIVQLGSDGKKEVIYRFQARNGLTVEEEILAEKTIKEPVTEVVRRGTKALQVASRGGTSGIFAWPLPNYIRVTSDFGRRKNPITGKVTQHDGIDIAAPIGSNVVAAADGVVTFIGWYGGYGKTVIVDHGGGLTTTYGHLSGYNVKKGQKVRRGEKVGEAGSTGLSTGPHLDFSVRVDGRPVTPWKYLK